MLDKADEFGASIKGLLGWSLVYLLVMPPVAAFLALNFTGASTFTSRSWVKREIFTYVPIMAIMAGTGILIVVTLMKQALLGETKTAECSC